MVELVGRISISIDREIFSVRSTSGPGDYESMYINTYIYMSQIGRAFLGPRTVFVSIELESNVPDSMLRDEEAFASNHPLRDILVVAEITI